MKLRSLFCLFICIVEQFCFAQLPEKALLFDRITIKDGLSQGMVNSILQDDYGFMWFATNDGLNRYDGRHFTIFKNKVDDNKSIAENFITYLFKDSHGRIWISTLANGLDLFDVETETFIHFKHNPQNSNSIQSNQVNCIGEDKNGSIWVLTEAGLDRLKISEKQSNSRIQNEKYTVQVTHIDLNTDQANEQGSAILNSRQKKKYHRFIIDSENNLWLYGPAYLNRIRILKNDTYQTKQLDLINYSPKTYSSTKENHKLFCIINKPDERKNYFMFNNGITCSNSINKTIGTIPFIYNGGFTPFSGIFDNQHQLWTINDYKLCLIDFPKNNLSIITHGNPDIQKMLRSVVSFYKDLSGNIWIGTNGYGILKHAANSNQFNVNFDVPTYTMASGVNQTLLLKHNNIEQNQHGETRLMDALDVKTNKRIAFPLSVFMDKQNKLKLLAGKGDFGIVQDDSTSIWVGFGNLYHLGVKGSNPHQECFIDSIGFGILTNDALGNLWYCTHTSLVCFNKQTKNRTSYVLPHLYEFGSYLKIQCIYPNTDGMVWLGTTDGLLKFNSATKQWKHYKNIPGNAQSLSMNTIFTICPDPVQPKEVIWLGTNGGGLNRLDVKTGKVKRFDISDGLPNNVIYGILSDADGNLWMSTNNGLSKYAITQNRFKNYEEKDGLQGNEFNRRAYCKLENNILCFGGMNGFNWFNPRNIVESDFQPQLAITRFTFNNELVDFSSDNSIYKKPIHLTRSIELDASYKTLSIEYCAFDFVEIRNNRYQYKLAGFDKEWVDAGTNNVAHYTNLDPGTYVFQVKGTNSDGKWSKNEASLEIIILPPWYMTWWFRTLLGMTLIGFLYMLYRFRLNKILEIHKVRNNIARDLHDEIGSNLSTISIFSDLAKNPNKSMQEVRTLNEKIFGYAQTSQIAMSDIVWMANTKNDRFENILSRMNAYATEVLEPQNITIHFDEPPALYTIQLNMEKRKAFYLIYKEAINNLAKYAQASEVFITFMKVNANIKMIIADNGIGFEMKPINEKSHNENGLLNMKIRAEKLNGKITFETSPGNGLKIELIFPIH